MKTPRLMMKGGSQYGSRGPASLRQTGQREDSVEDCRSAWLRDCAVRKHVGSYPCRPPGNGQVYGCPQENHRRSDTDTEICSRDGILLLLPARGQELL